MNNFNDIENEFKILQNKFYKIKQQFNTMKLLFDQYESLANRFNDKLIKYCFTLNNNVNDEDKNLTSKNSPPDETIKIIVEITEQDPMMNNDNNVPLPMINELNIENIDSLSNDTIDKLIDVLYANIIKNNNDDDSPIDIDKLFNNIFNDLIQIFDDYQQIDVETNSLIDDQYAEDESMKTAEEYCSNTDDDDDGIVDDELKNCHITNHTLLSDESGCTELFDNDLISDSDGRLTTSTPSSESNESIINKNNDKPTIEFNNDNLGTNDNEITTNEKFSNDLRIDIVHDQNDNKLIDFYIPNTNGQSKRERVILKPIESNDNNNEFIGKKNKYYNSDDDDDDDLRKTRTSSLNEQSTKDDDDDDDDNNNNAFDWRKMRNYWERKSLGPHKRFGQKKFKKI